MAWSCSSRSPRPPASSYLWPSSASFPSTSVLGPPASRNPRSVRTEDGRGSSPGPFQRELRVPRTHPPAPPAPQPRDVADPDAASSPVSVCGETPYGVSAALSVFRGEPQGSVIRVRGTKRRGKSRGFACLPARERSHVRRKPLGRHRASRSRDVAHARPSRAGGSFTIRMRLLPENKNFFYLARCILHVCSSV